MYIKINPEVSIWGEFHSILCNLITFDSENVETIKSVSTIIQQIYKSQEDFLDE